MKKLLLSLLLLFPFAAAKADIIKTTNYNFTGTSSIFLLPFYDYLGGNSFSASGIYKFNQTTGLATDFSLTITGSNYFNITYGFSDLIESGNSNVFYLPNMVVGDFTGPYFYAFGSNSDVFEDFSSTTLTSTTTLVDTSIAPVPEPSSWVLGLGGLMGMTVLASRKKKSTASILKAPALVA